MWVIFLALFACNPENKLEEDPSPTLGEVPAASTPNNAERP